MMKSACDRFQSCEIMAESRRVISPVDQPRYACGVVVEHGIGGSGVAAPICNKILTEAQRRLRQRLPGAQRVADGRS